MKQLLSFFFLVGIYTSGNSQCLNNNSVYQRLLAIETSSSIANNEKLKQAKWLQNQFNICRLTKDSVYARLLHRIGLYEYLSNNQIPTKDCINNTLEAITINTSGRKSSNEAFAVNSYSNVANYYKTIMAYDKALLYLDTTIMIGKKHAPLVNFVMNARLIKVLLFKDNGDYGKSIEQSSIGLVEAKSAGVYVNVLKLFNQRALCELYQGQLQSALADANSAIRYSQLLSEDFELSTAIKTKALIYGELKMMEAEALFKKSILLRIKTKQDAQIADDYLDFGNYYLNGRKNTLRGKQCYLKVIEFSEKVNDDEKKAKAQACLGLIEVHQKNYESALALYSKSNQSLLHSGYDYTLENPNFVELNSLTNKNLLISVLNNKIEALILNYKKTKDDKFIRAAIKTALLTDTLITAIRYQQVNEQSKLYWRNQSKEIYNYAIEAAYLTNNNNLAFFFMEKSRAVLLNDKLNELGAALHLPEKEVLKEQEFRIKVVSEQQKLALLTPGSKEYADQQLKLLNAQDEFDRYIKSLDKSYPLYYQYKYDDKVPTLADLQKYLTVKKENFIHYFINDTVAYILQISGSNSRMIKVADRGNLTEQINSFLTLCSDASALNNNYAVFASQASSLYKTLFEPLPVSKGRVVISPDNFLLPFEALCKDEKGKEFLLYDYAFSYVYSARFLLKKFSLPSAHDDFIGFAPVSFQSSLNVSELKNSADALANSASNYKTSSLLTHNNASRNRFINEIGNYSVANIFSHAFADSTDSEPMFFMQDSVIRLSELQLLKNPATQLVVLSACQTNVGKNASGEGIYSLARGFTSAGIPSIAATLWKADEEAIYEISQKFHEFLAQGMCKDDALQKSKLIFIKKGHQKLLPYYWANMILMGNAEPVDLANHHTLLFMLAAAIVAIMALTFFIRKVKYGRNS